MQTTFGLSPRPDLAKGIIPGNYLWACKGQVSWLDAGLPRLRDRRVGFVRDAGQSIAMCTAVKRRFLQRFLNQIDSESLIDGIAGTCHEEGGDNLGLVRDPQT